jgi:hypothetical protein
VGQATGGADGQTGGRAGATSGRLDTLDRLQVLQLEAGRAGDGLTSQLSEVEALRQAVDRAVQPREPTK